MPSYAGKVKINNQEYPIAATLYGVCNTGAADQVKQVEVAEFDTLVQGVLVAVYFDKANTAANPQLRVGTTDAKPIYLDNNNAPGTTELKSWRAKEVVLFIYDGNYWMMCADRKAVHDAITSLQTNMGTAQSDITSLGTRMTTAENKIGNVTMPTTAQTLTGAIKEHETDITGLTTRMGTAEGNITSVTNTVNALPGTATPKMDGTAAVGTATKFARQDHVHPVDTSRAAQSSLNTTNTNVSNLTTTVNGKETKKLIFTSKTASSWTNNGSTAFPKRCAIACSGVTAAMTALVFFAAAQAESGNYSPYAETYAGGVYIYSTQTTSITVPKILVFAGS